MRTVERTEAEIAARVAGWEAEAAEAVQGYQARAKALTWDELHAAMIACTGYGGPDQETAHVQADELLCIALLKARPDLVPLVRTYARSPKWYA